MKKITAKYARKCAETGKAIRKGEEMYYDYANRKCYHISTNKGSGNEVDGAGGMVQANEEAYFDNFCQHNNI